MIMTHTRIRTHTLTTTHKRNPNGFCLYFVVFSIFNSFHLLNCLMIVVLQKT